ncbi:MAG: acetyltransferase [Deltaproteobacteria bacterium]|nr:acetyltransferase [Deltaproteobacteria bacterium]
MKSLILIGDGGHCRACIDVIESQGLYNIAGIVDVSNRVGKSVLGYKIIASDEQLSDLARNYDNFFLAVGQIKTSEIRQEIIKKFSNIAISFPIIISPHATVSKHSLVGLGSIVMHRAAINANASIGDHCIINTGAIVEHDASISDFSHVSTAAVINGGVSIGRGCFIGSNVTIKEGIKISDHVIIGAGSLVIKDIIEPGIYAGSPALRMAKQ